MALGPCRRPLNICFAQALQNERADDFGVPHGVSFAAFGDDPAVKVDHGHARAGGGINGK
jgi:hypothetical protein